MRQERWDRLQPHPTDMPILNDVGVAAYSREVIADALAAEQMTMTSLLTGEAFGPPPRATAAASSSGGWPGHRRPPPRMHFFNPVRRAEPRGGFLCMAAARLPAATRASA